MTDESAYGGLFQDPPYLSTNADPQKTDPYDKQDCIPSRYLGKSMLTGGSACPGKLPESLFEKKYLTLASDEQNAEVYAINDKATKQRASAAAKTATKPISDTHFRVSSFPAKSTGPGSYYGCIQRQPFEHDVDSLANSSKLERKNQAKREKAAAEAAAERQRVNALPNIKTNPGRKGTYGYPGLLLSTEPYNENWRADADASAKGKTAAAAVEHTPMGPPFRVSGVSRAYLDEQPNTGVPGVYAAQEPAAAADRKGKADKSLQSGAAPVQSIHEKPFYGSCVRSGQQGCINAFPNVWVDPRVAEAEEQKKARKKKKSATKEQPVAHPKGAADWKPNSFSKTSVISSCLRRFY